jgi:hypothetical protein
MADLILLVLCTIALGFYIYVLVQFVRDERRYRENGRQARPTVIRPEGTGSKSIRRWTR